MLNLITHQLIMANKQTLSCHASTLLPLDDGKVLAAWFGGSREGRGDVGIWLSVKGDKGFSEPRLVAGSTEPHWNPVLFRRLDGRIMLFYKRGWRIPDWQTYVIESRDEGQTWSEPRELVPGDTSGGRGPVRNKPLRLKSGRVLAPASVERGLWRCFVDISDDDGATWRKSNLIEAAGTAQYAEGIAHWQAQAAQARAAGVPFDYSQVPPEYAHGRGVIQPSLWQDENGVHMLMRSGEGYIYRSDSIDDGETWCEAYATPLANNNSGIDLTCLPGGQILLAHNPVMGNFAARTPLSLSLSDDGGRSFVRLCDLEAEMGEFSYPAVVCRGDRVHISYTWKRENIAYWEFGIR